MLEESLSGKKRPACSETKCTDRELKLGVRVGVESRRCLRRFTDHLLETSNGEVGAAIGTCCRMQTIRMLTGRK
jgi:hypothetical protein